VREDSRLIVRVIARASSWVGAAAFILKDALKRVQVLITLVTIILPSARRDDIAFLADGHSLAVW